MVTVRDIGALVTDDPADLPQHRHKRPTAFLWPESGGAEWLVSPDSVQRIEKAPVRTLSP